MVGGAGGGFKYYVGHACALGAGQPGGYKGVGGVKLGVDPQRATGQED